MLQHRRIKGFSEYCAHLQRVNVTARQETLASVPGQPALLQLPIVPSYALTVHKTQALSIKHVVRGCLEGAVRLAEHISRILFILVCLLPCAWGITDVLC